jgi:hypothetical protein
MEENAKRWTLDLTVWTASLAAALALVSHEAAAGGNLAAAHNPAYVGECGSCHLAYPPQLLPAAAWRRTMAGLDKHFGTDASLDAKYAAEIGAFLERNAGTGKRTTGAEGATRISRTPWFVRKHDEVSPAAWKRASIGSAGNCAACHAGAARGDFNEHAVLIPR